MISDFRRLGFSHGTVRNQECGEINHLLFFTITTAVAVATVVVVVVVVLFEVQT
jgi:hypothetical protein